MVAISFYCSNNEQQCSTEICTSENGCHRYHNTFYDAIVDQVFVDHSTEACIVCKHKKYLFFKQKSVVTLLTRQSIIIQLFIPPVYPVFVQKDGILPSLIATRYYSNWETTAANYNFTVSLFMRINQRHR